MKMDLKENHKLQQNRKQVFSEYELERKDQ